MFLRNSDNFFPRSYERLHNFKHPMFNHYRHRMQNQLLRDYSITKEDEESNIFLLNVPMIGFKKEEVKVEIANKTLMINASRVVDSSTATTYLYKGLVANEYQREFSLDDNVKVVSASLNEGILTVKLEKHIPEKDKPLTVEVL